MTNTIGVNGITINSLSTIISNIAAGLQGIYGNDINIDQNSADGQCIGIAAQAARDILEFIVSVNNGFDPDQATGATLDQRVAINYISRKGGTYTVQPIDITVNATVTLQGLDDNFNNPNGTGYTIQDDSGNEFILSTSQTFTAGTTTVDFRAQQIGAVNVPVNTITTPVTIILGVTGVNNSSAALSVGQNQETDAQLRTRRQQSVALASSGYLNGLLGTVLNLTGVTEAVLYENDTGATDANGIPDHGVWLVVAGGATPDIANAIYAKKSYGCNLKGSITFPITTASGLTFTAKFDNPAPENLYIEFTIKRTVAGFSFNTTAIAAYIAANLTYGIGGYAETSSLTQVAIAAILAQGGGGVPVLTGISSDGVTYTDYLATATIGSQWTLDPSRINITVV